MACMFISNNEIKENLTFQELIPSIETGLALFSSKSNSDIVQPLRTTLNLITNSVNTSVDESSPKGYLLSMPAFSNQHNALATKLLTVFHGNRELPAIQGCIVLFDPDNGQLLAVMGAEEITGRRTAAASAVAVKHLKMKESTTIAIIGSGLQAEMHVLAMDALNCFSEIILAGRSYEKVQNLVKHLPSPLPQNTRLSSRTSIKEAVLNADVICTVTSSSTPVIQEDWLKQQSLIVCVGACTPDSMELDPEITLNSEIYVDSRDGALNESGDLMKNKIKDVTELGDVISGKVKTSSCSVNNDKRKYCVFKSLGIAVEDAIAARLVYDKMKKH